MKSRVWQLGLDNNTTCLLAMEELMEWHDFQQIIPRLFIGHHVVSFKAHAAEQGSEWHNVKQSPSILPTYHA